MLDRFFNLNAAEIKKTMQEGDIQTASLACGSNKNAIATKQLSVPYTNSLSAETRFGIASLSKPVFAYLVLKLVGSNGFKLDTKLNDIVPFEKFCEKFDIIWDNSEENKKKVNSFTPSMVLSHQTGLPIGYKGKKSGALQFDFDPSSKEFAYSGIALMYLQSCLEKKFDMSLEALAKKHVFDPAGMKNSSFYPHFNLLPTSDPARKHGNMYLDANKNGLQYELIQNFELKKGTIPWNKLPTDFPRKTSDIVAKKEELLSIILDQTSKAKHTPPANAANSMQTTANDYVLFCLDWMHNEDKNMQDAFKAKVSMNNDAWAKNKNVPQPDLDHVDWGYGWGLERVEKEGKQKHYAFHTGDMNEWRAGVKLDLDEKTATVFLSKSNSQNGHLLQEQIFGEKSHALNYFFIKFDFARKVEELPFNWQNDPCYGAKHRDVAQPPQHPLVAQAVTSSTAIFSALTVGKDVGTSDYIKTVIGELSPPQKEKAAKPGQSVAHAPESSLPTNSNQQEEHSQQARAAPSPLTMTPTPSGIIKK